ncbi:20972_t:CDS:2, partial [Racocetra persica]
RNNYTHTRPRWWYNRLKTSEEQFTGVSTFSKKRTATDEDMPKKLAKSDETNFSQSHKPVGFSTGSFIRTSAALPTSRVSTTQFFIGLSTAQPSILTNQHVTT